HGRREHRAAAAAAAALPCPPRHLPPAAPCRTGRGEREPLSAPEPRPRQRRAAPPQPAPLPRLGHGPARGVPGLHHRGPRPARPRRRRRHRQPGGRRPPPARQLPQLRQGRALRGPLRRPARPRHLPRRRPPLEVWSLQRKLASYSFSSRSLRRFSGRVLREHLHCRLLPLLDDAAGSGVAFDLQDVLRRCSFDNVCGVAFGVESSTLLELEAGDRRSRRHEAFFAAFDDAVEISFARILHPTTLVWKAMRLANVGSERRMREAIGVIDAYVMGMLEAEQRPRGVPAVDGEGEREQHLLSRFMAALDEESASGSGSELGEMFGSPDAKRRFLRDIVVSFVLAGKDSTSSALTWFFWLLAANPRCERCVHEEVTRTPPGDDAGESEELKGMHYLHAALTEAMRLYPPLPINTRVAAAADVLPDGTTVRAGWFADYSAYAMGRMPRLWGDHCLEFRPERWLKGDRGEFVSTDAARYPVFHAGPRACLGKEMAYVQMKAAAAAVIRRFAVEMVATPASMDAPPPYELGATLRMKGGLHVRIMRRDDHF
uniref:Cytochrome P450 n=2 Tax=Aegilops tauschii subsp. strangulata TaxID=200361 RepID=A0A453GP47_AEGTS